MLWYKAWLETRTRFAICLLGMTVLCGLGIYRGDRQVGPQAWTGYYYHVLGATNSFLCLLWVVAVTLLTMGGLLREKAVGAAPLTLSLPVSRARLMGIRVGMGIAEAVTLALIPWIAMYGTAVATGKADSLYQASFYLVLLVSGGMVFFGLALLTSSLVEGEYTAPVLSFGVVIAAEAMLGNGSPDAYTPFRFTAGAEYFERSTQMLRGPIPWRAAALSISLAALLVAISVMAIQRREF